MSGFEPTNVAPCRGRRSGLPTTGPALTERTRAAALVSGTALVLALGVPGARAADTDSPATAPLPAQAPAPIGVFGADMPGQGKFVFSFSPSFSRSQGNLIGGNSVTPQYIVSNVGSNYTPVGEHLLRMVPKSMSVDSQALGVAYGLNDEVTLNASTALLEKNVNMETFAGLSGTTPLGYSVGRTAGIGDTSVASIVRVYQDPINRVNVNFGLSLPTGSTVDDISLLTPADVAPPKRGFYAMQPGSGTVDAMPGIAYTGVLNAWSWGLGYRGRLPLDRNDHGWRYGDMEEINAWGGYAWTPDLETTLRLNGTTQGSIRGQDPLITGYGQSADPLYYGGQQIGLFGGVVASGRYIGLASTQFGLEAGVPLYQQLNGPQLARDWQINLALRYKL